LIISHFSASALREGISRQAAEPAEWHNFLLKYKNLSISNDDLERAPMTSFPERRPAKAMEKRSRAASLQLSADQPL
jgi:hypothetical protein